MRISVIQLIALVMLGVTFGTHLDDMRGDQIAPVTINVSRSEIDSVTNLKDSLESEWRQRETRTTDSHLEAMNLLSKYELALEDLKIYRPESYERFIRIAEFRETYTESIRSDFINEHKRVIRRSAEAFQ
jgi:hypothetical protein